jgi:hypothetical protein
MSILPDNGLEEEVQNLCHLDLQTLDHYFYLWDYVKLGVNKENKCHGPSEAKNQT